MVVRIERNFSLVGRCFLICCILASLDANESDATRCRPRSSRAEGEQRLSGAADDGPLRSEAAVQHSRTDDTVESSRPTATVERNSNALAEVAAKPANGVAAGSAANSENSGASASVDKITNRKSQPANYGELLINRPNILYPKEDTFVDETNNPLDTRLCSWNLKYSPTYEAPYFTIVWLEWDSVAPRSWNSILVFSDTYSDIFTSEKNDSILYSPAVGGVGTPTSFTVVKESLIPTSEEIAYCMSNFVAGVSLCNTTLHYPKLFVNNILQRRHSIPYSFEDDLLSPWVEIHTCGTKFEVDQDFESLCASREFLYYPRMGKTASNGWKYIVQSDDNSQQNAQGVRVEVCAKENQKCDLVDNFPIGYDVQCVQKYTYRRLLAVSPNEKAATPDNFEFPSCCVCAYKSKVGC